MHWSKENNGMYKLHGAWSVYGACMGQAWTDVSPDSKTVAAGGLKSKTKKQATHKHWTHIWLGKGPNKARKYGL